MPKCFHDCVLIPIPKSCNDLALSEKYHPISLASCFSKVLEHLISTPPSSLAIFLPTICFENVTLKYTDEVKHLSYILNFNLDDGPDIIRALKDLNEKANSVLFDIRLIIVVYGSALRPDPSACWDGDMGVSTRVCVVKAELISAYRCVKLTRKL